MTHPNRPVQPARKPVRDDAAHRRNVAISVLSSVFVLALAVPVNSHAQAVPATPQAVVTAAVIPPSGVAADRPQDGAVTPEQGRSDGRAGRARAMPTARPLPTPDSDLPIDGVSRPRTSPQTLAILGGLVVASLALLAWDRFQRWRTTRADQD